MSNRQVIAIDPIVYVAPTLLCQRPIQMLTPGIDQSPGSRAGRASLADDRIRVISARPSMAHKVSCSGATADIQTTADALRTAC
jgi:hypothetical protein